MAQGKPSDERIESKANRSAYIKTGDTPEEFEPYKAGFIHGATWYKDNHDPWFYVEDGELPEFNSDTKKSEELQLKVVDGENDFGWLVQHPNGKNHYWETYDAHEINGKDTDVLELNEVHCWQYIEEPQK